MLLPIIPLAVLLSTKGLMFMLLSAYGGAMWTFLSGAPRVYTIVVPDLDEAKEFYEQQLNLPEAELPLNYYYGYEQTMGSFDPMYYPSDVTSSYGYRPSSTAIADNPGLWYQLSDNSQLHVIVGSVGSDSSQYVNRKRHVSFDRDGLKELLKYISKRKLPHTIRTQKPLSFLVRDRDGQVVELSEVED
jgi:catechol 2,3-dioxygenase-like lactoylglutathione lyase family enzyme